MTEKLDYRWHLRQVMAGRGMFSTTDLAEPLKQRGIALSSSQVYRLVVERPERLSLKVLMALLDILECTMEDIPGRPISGSQLGERLRRHGIRPSQARSTALFQLAAELPAAVLARTLGVHISSATAWQRAASGDWAVYAAEVGRQPERTQPQF